MENTNTNVNGTIDHAADKVRGNLREMKGEAGQAVSTVRDAVNDLSKQASSTARTVASRLVESGEEAVEKSKEALNTYCEEGKKQFDSLEKYVRDQPIKSVLIGAAAGMLLGRFFKN